MPRGGPDYKAPAYQVAGAQVDTGDLVTALRGVNTVDGLGRPIFFETFGEGLAGWFTQGVSGGSVAVVDTTIVEIPPACAYLRPGSTAGTSYSLINRTQRISGTRSAGAEVGFCLTPSWSDRIALLGFRVSDAYLIGGIKYGYDGKLYYLNASNAWTLIETLISSGSENAWMTVKVVVDADLRAYKRFIVGQKSYDISGFSLYDLGASTVEELSLTVEGLARAGSSTQVRVGHVILTLDEP